MEMGERKEYDQNKLHEACKSYFNRTQGSVSFSSGPARRQRDRGSKKLGDQETRFSALDPRPLAPSAPPPAGRKRGVGGGTDQRRNPNPAANSGDPHSRRCGRMRAGSDRLPHRARATGEAPQPFKRLPDLGGQEHRRLHFTGPAGQKPAHRSSGCRSSVAPTFNFKLRSACLPASQLCLLIG